MDKSQVIQYIWSQFGLMAYDENTVPTGSFAPSFPYITYNVVTDNLDHPVNLNGSIWYRSTSWADISKKADEIAEYIGSGGRTLPITINVIGGEIKVGYIYICRGVPFAQRMADDSDDMVRRMYINLQAEFFTEN